MSLLWLWALGLTLIAAPGDALAKKQPGVSRLESPARTALKEQAPPWYDQENDQVHPLLPDPSTWRGWLQKRFDAFLDWMDRYFGKGSDDPKQVSDTRVRGGFATILLIAAGVIFLLLLLRLWRTYTPGEATSPDRSAHIGDAARVAGLAPGIALEGIDPCTEAQRRRAAGDTAGAVIWLFLDQLLSLQRAGLIRLLPGRTARQYAGALADPILANGLRTTLGVFEQVYYGHRHPGLEELEQVWSQAERFRRRLQSSAVGMTP